MAIPEKSSSDMQSADSASRILRAYVAGQAGLGYSRFEPGPGPSDIILATYPKSGSTWTSYLLHQIRSGGNETFVDIKDEVVDITPGHWDPALNPFLLEQHYFPRTFKTHGSYRHCPRGGKYIYVARNPKDTLWSLYHFIHDLFDIDEKMPLDEFYQQFYVERFGTGHDIGNTWDHILGWYPHKTEESLLWLHYEDLLQNQPECIRSIARFMRVPLDDNLLELVMERSDISHMRQIAAKINPSPGNRVGKVVAGFGPEMASYAQKMKFGKVRRGVAGDGLENLPQDIVVDMDRQWRQRITPVLGYASYADMRNDNRI